MLSSALCVTSRALFFGLSDRSIVAFSCGGCCDGGRAVVSKVVGRWFRRWSGGGRIGFVGRIGRQWPAVSIARYSRRCHSERIGRIGSIGRIGRAVVASVARWSPRSRCSHRWSHRLHCLWVVTASAAGRIGTSAAGRIGSIGRRSHRPHRVHRSRINRSHRSRIGRSHTRASVGRIVAHRSVA